MITFVYAVLAIAYLLLQNREERWLVVLKPLPILLLAVWVAIRLGDGWLIATLLLSAAGDSVLALNSERYFVQGLSFFLLAHVAYAVVFGRNITFTSASIIPLLIIMILAALLLPRLLPKLGKLRIPVLCYIGIIVIMSILGALHSPFTVSLAVGAIIFMISDATIALDKFVQPVPYRNFIVMATYYLAQYLIAYTFVVYLG